MMFLFLTLLDLLTAIVLIGAHYGIVSHSIMFYHGTYSIGKGVWYFNNWMSWMDIIIGVWVWMMIIGVKGYFTWVAVSFLMYKIIVFLLFIKS